MFRLFIVDDNKYERNTMKEVIEWSSLGIEVVGLFANGLEALSRMDDLRPHIVITDIAMPLMNGVELSARIRQSHPHVKIIFVSSHSDFEFAKSAVELGIYGYVLKPIMPDELELAIHKLLAEFTQQHREQIEKERMLKQLEGMLPLVQEQFLKEVLLGNFRTKEDILDKIEFLALPIVDHANMSVISINSLAADKQEHRSARDAYFLSYSIKSLISKAGNATRSMYPVQISADEYAVIVFDLETDRQDVIDAAVQLHTAINGELGIHATMGISTSSRELTELDRLYMQSQQAVNTRFYSGSNPIIRFEEIEDRSDIPMEDMPSLVEVYQDLKALMSFGNDQDVEEFIEKYLNAVNVRQSENYVKGFALLCSHLSGILFMEANQSMKDVFGDNLAVWDKLNRMSTKVEVVQWIRQSFEVIKERVTDRNSSKNVKIIAAIKQMIHDNYREQISIEDISKSVYLSGRHANGTFKKETGQTIFDYLVQYRTDKAKQLLREEGSKVAAVAEAVGYVSTSYFILAFKKNVGMTPAEFKSKAAL
ncbi:response regulator [Paenibacillus sp. CF384]|uniref:response regulator transcription factor n=1 Tax=Paenibacillus sp. CF384 TaxID=1884382 RepID=UPI0008969D03|nr:response regulator [Paenibacillus sp. CF384]SDX63646.1 Two-component response regulator, YesN/AraC family, consists of REC and AraC-type DNA-binding domains [Paenibacillus sp. CF384]